MPRGPTGEEGEEEGQEEGGQIKKWEENEREIGKRDLHTPLDASLLPSAGREKTSASLNFPGVRFADENIIIKPHKETQVVVESMKKNEVQDTRPKEEVEEMVEVDWFGTPLANSTLPDYTTMYRHHYPNPHLYHHHHLHQRGGRLEGVAGKTRELHEQVVMDKVYILFILI